MSRIAVGIFLLLHGLAHIWYVILSRGLVEFQEEMGWSGKSWLFTNLIGDGPARLLASIFYILSIVGFIIAGVGILSQQEWWRVIVIISASLSAATIVLFWDGSMQYIVQKGLLGLLINAAILFSLLAFKWPVFDF